MFSSPFQPSLTHQRFNESIAICHEDQLSCLVGLFEIFQIIVSSENETLSPVQYLLSLTHCVAVAYRLGIALSTGDVFELRASEALEERVMPLLFRIHSVRRPVPQHEEEVREPRRLAGGKTEQGDTRLV